jgi:predicted negative regulator of RcsB-dependent stress response
MLTDQEQRVLNVIKQWSNIDYDGLWCGALLAILMGDLFGW